jgi:large subunit ribosomal protein L3
MTQMFGEDNRLHPVTVVQVGPCPITQVKTLAKDGYEAVQIGFGPQKASRMSNAELKHLEKAGVEPVSHLKEFRVSDSSGFNVGDVLTVSSFQNGEMIDVIGVSKGRGFQGVMKRFDFAGGPASHGSMFHRRGGSFGMRQTPGHIFKNKKMPGHMGDDRRTVQNLEILKVLPEKNILLIKGSLPGSNGSLVTVRTAKKTRKQQVAK